MSLLISGAKVCCAVRRTVTHSFCLLPSSEPYQPTNPPPSPRAAVGLTLPYTPVGRAERFTALPPSFYAWVAATVGGYALTVQLAKWLYIRRFRAWL